MSEPTTEAGRRMLSRQLDPTIEPGALAGYARAEILAIEREAVEAERARLRAAVASAELPVNVIAEGAGLRLNAESVRAAVLALLDGARQEADND